LVHQKSHSIISAPDCEIRRLEDVKKQYYWKKHLQRSSFTHAGFELLKRGFNGKDTNKTKICFLKKIPNWIYKPFKRLQYAPMVRKYRQANLFIKYLNITVYWFSKNIIGSKGAGQIMHCIPNICSWRYGWSNVQEGNVKTKEKRFIWCLGI
jgi:hypothetical protein